MLKDDWCFCPNSKFPALYSEYMRFIENEYKSALKIAGGRDDDSQFSSPSRRSAAVAMDPILGQNVSISDLTKSTPEEALKYIQKYNNVKEEKPKGEKDDKEEGNKSNPSSPQKKNTKQ
mmetsp:Transcript_5933/g.11338  ORF Transcript_5933/g.11338 Transcript_5933/m.11338 type:complete len:119 (+) Transcript_5933:1-357(+)